MKTDERRMKKEKSKDGERTRADRKIGGAREIGQKARRWEGT